MPNIEPIERHSLHATLTTRLRSLIADGVLPPGSKIIEKELCESFDVSRTPLREAIRALAAEGLVVLTPNRGASVATVSQAQILESFELMGALEGLAGELAAGRITDADLAEVGALHAMMVDCYKAGDLDGYYRHNRAIHDAIFDATGNALLCDVRRNIYARIVSLRFVARIDDDEWAAAISEHEEMLAALLARDGPALGGVLRRHLASKLAHVTHWLSRQSPTEAEKE